MAFLGHGRQGQRLGDEAREEREGRDRGRPDQAEDRGRRHRLEQPAQFGRLDGPDPQHHRAHAHEQQRLVDDVHEGVRRRAIDGELGADTDPHDHEAELVVEREGQHLAQVILDHREEDREGRHDGADPDQLVGARIAPRQGIDRQLGGEGRQHDRPGDGRLGIGVLQPVVQEGEGALDAEGDEDQEAAQRLDGQRLVKGPAAGLAGTDDRTGEEQHAGQDVDRQIAQAGLVGGIVAGTPDQEDRGDRGQFPEHEEREQVAGEYGTQTGTGIDQTGGIGDAVLLMQPVERIDESGDDEDQAPDPGQTVKAEGFQRETAQRDDPAKMVAGRRVEPQAERQHRRDQREGLAHLVDRESRCQQAGNDDRPGR